MKTAKDICDLVEKECEQLSKPPRKRFGGQRVLAAKLGVSQAHLSEVMRGARRPTKRIAGYFGYVPVTMYVLQEEFSEFGDDE
jgi:hypothetical protein